jgi:hypothetical protein
MPETPQTTAQRLAVRLSSPTTRHPSTGGTHPRGLSNAALITLVVLASCVAILLTMLLGAHTGTPQASSVPGQAKPVRALLDEQVLAARHAEKAADKLQAEIDSRRPAISRSVQRVTDLGEAEDLAWLREVISRAEAEAAAKKARIKAAREAARAAAAKEARQAAREAARAAAAKKARQATRQAARQAARAVTATDPGTLRDMARNEMLAYGYAASQWTYLDQLIMRESGWNPRAENPTSGAYGLPQSLPGNKMASIAPDWKTNPRTQIIWMLGYIKDRYGSPQGAWGHSQSVGWY